jgi:hypothetical protein
MTDKTLFQQLVVNAEAESMLEYLEDVDFGGDTDALELRVKVTKGDVPRLIGELREMVE